MKKSLNELYDALKKGEIKLYYQPKCDMRNNMVFGAEALIRWQHPRRGLLLPEDFLPNIKEKDFLIELGDWVMNTTLKQLEQWSNAYKHISISINLDAIYLESGAFIKTLQEKLLKYSPDIIARLECEILETTVISNPNYVYNLIKECSQYGILFSLDDFGTEFSSINTLLRLPFSYMKIDVNFVKNILNNERDIKILKAILDIADAANIKVIAEGVETQAHVDLLLKLGCFLGQGFVFSKALPAEKFELWYQSFKK